MLSGLGKSKKKPFQKTKGMITAPFSIDFVMESSRGIAALWVFFFHISSMVQTSWPSGQTLAKYGHYGVSMFFVISGYCIFASAEKIAQDSSYDYMGFIKRRLFRILPAFWISIIVVLILPFFIESLSALKSGNYQQPQPAWIAYSLSDWLSIISLTKDIFDTGSSIKQGFTLVNSVYWTLAIEIQFYIVIFIALLFKQKWKIILSFITFASLFANHIPFQPNGFFLAFWPIFAIGCGLRIIHTKGFVPSKIFGTNILSFSFTGIFITLVFGIGILLVQPAVPSVTLALFFSILLWCFGGVEHFFRTKHQFNSESKKAIFYVFIPFIMLGECSYSLYLLHGKIYHLPEMFIRQVLDMSSPLYLISVIFSTSALCYGYYLLVERPFQRLQLRRSI